MAECAPAEGIAMTAAGQALTAYALTVRLWALGLGAGRPPNTPPHPG
jgi:hypothetical protein